ncbi:hypothetical protein PspLS_01238 [Pyricularia sp. CBS 133598]|nr:hypothetical protein PspLS_01238 [Pyricularia sp. CBS 133598]
MFFSAFLSLAILLLTLGGALPVPPPLPSSPHLTSPELVVPGQEWHRSRPTAVIRKRAPSPWELPWPFSSTSSSPRRPQPSTASSWFSPSSWRLWGQNKGGNTASSTSGRIPAANKNQQKAYGGAPKQQVKNTPDPRKSNTRPSAPPQRQDSLASQNNQGIQRKPLPQSAKLPASPRPGPPPGNPTKEPPKSSSETSGAPFSNVRPWGPDRYVTSKTSPSPRGYTAYKPSVASPPEKEKPPTKSSSVTGYRAYAPPAASKPETEKSPTKSTDAPKTASSLGPQPTPAPGPKPAEESKSSQKSPVNPPPQSPPSKSSPSSSPPSGQSSTPPSKGPETPGVAENKQTTLDSWLAKGQKKTEPVNKQTTLDSWLAKAPKKSESAKQSASVASSSPSAASDPPSIPVTNKKLPDSLTIKRPETLQAAEKPQPEKQPSGRKPLPSSSSLLTPPPSPIIEEGLPKGFPSSLKIGRPDIPKEAKKPQPEKQSTGRELLTPPPSPVTPEGLPSSLKIGRPDIPKETKTPQSEEPSPPPNQGTHTFDSFLSQAPGNEGVWSWNPNKNK